MGATDTTKKPRLSVTNTYKIIMSEMSNIVNFNLFI
nr:unnamed protein product [Callosobruchus chinensis]